MPRCHSNQVVLPFPANIDRRDFGNWLSGFTDGEGSFGLWLTNRRRTGSARFSLEVRDDDEAAIRAIQSFWQCGRIVAIRQRPYRSSLPNANPGIGIHVQDFGSLVRIVIPHFEKHPLRAKKSRDFSIWREAVLFAYSISLRKKMTRGYNGGTFPRWSLEELRRFHELAELLKKQRRYQSPTYPLPPAMIPSQKRLFD